MQAFVSIVNAVEGHTHATLIKVGPEHSRRLASLFVAVGIEECRACQPLSNGLLHAEMYVERVATVVADHHLREIAVCQSALTITEGRPRRTVQTRELNIMEREAPATEILSPAVAKQAEEPFVEFDVMCIRLALIPRHTFYMIMVEGQDASFEHVAGLIGMALAARAVQVGLRLTVLLYVHRLSNVLQRPSSCPRLTIIAEIPVGQDVGKFLLQRVSVNPRLGGGSAHSVADDSYGHLQRIGQHATHVVGNGREVLHILSRRRLPSGFLQ